MSIFSVVNTPLKWIFLLAGIGTGVTGGLVVGRKMNKPKLERIEIPDSMKDMKLLAGRGEPKEFGDVELKNSGDWLVVVGKDLCPKTVGNIVENKIPGGEIFQIRAWGENVKCLYF